MDYKKLPQVPSRTTSSFAFSIVERSLQECLGERHFGQAEIAQVIDFFGKRPPECVFCGSLEIKRWDHLIPVKKGGETVLENMVPACSPCDDSKRDLAFDEQITTDTPSSPKGKGVVDIAERKSLIHDYVQHFGYKLRPIDERLSSDELARLKEIRSAIQQLRHQIDDLIEDFRRSRGYK